MVAVVAACSSGSTGEHGSAHDTADPMTSHMNMPSNGSEGVHHAGGGTGLLATVDGYTVRPSTTALAIGEQTLRFQILDPHGMPQTQYVEDQTKLMHFYLVRRDLTGYQHLHPTLSAGTWSVKVQVDRPGPYRIYTDFIAKDGTGSEHPLVLSTEITAPGHYMPAALPAAAEATTAEGLTATLAGTITAGTASTVHFRITADGKPVTDLEPYLDSFAHLTALRSEHLAYRHVHPERIASAGQKGGPDLSFSVDLPEAGTWRLFLQVQRAGTLHLLPLTVTVR
jgi:hypothetical protein